jgi:hypothetical protein
LELYYDQLIFPTPPSRLEDPYRAAILETDKAVIQRRVAQAEQAVLARGRELFYRGGAHDEQESLEDALYALRAFRTAWEHTEVPEAA